MLVEKLPIEDKNIIADWIQWYGLSNRSYNSFPIHRMDSVDFILRYWDTNKQEYLWDLFGGQFILEKEVSYVRPRSILESQLDAALCSNNAMSCFHEELIREVEKEYSFYSDTCRVIRKMFSIECLSDNRWTWTSTVIVLRGKEIALPRNAKIMKILNKLAKIVDLEEEFEAFRIAHSQILNQKTLSGTLCLSIHPFDYMTLSDNDYNWDSCMNWIDDGCYRTGTVEMLNSKYMVVAYLKGDKPFRIDNRYWSGNKKWRELFVVSPTIICNVKAYPYQNDTLTQIALEWLRELAGRNLNWDVSYDACDFHNNNVITATDQRDYCFNLYYSYMYNDFDTSNTHHYAIIPQGWQPYDLKDERITYVDLNLSGQNVCMCCGELWEPFEGHEDQVLCRRCDPGVSCSCCGDEIEDEDGEYHVEGDTLCRYCFEEQANRCAITEDYYYNENMATIYCVPVDDNLTPGVWGLHSCQVASHYIQEGALRHVPMFKIDTFHQYQSEDNNEIIYYVNLSECSSYASEDVFGLWNITERTRYIDNYIQDIAEVLEQQQNTTEDEE